MKKLNQKIVDKIEEIKKLYFDYKNLENQRKSEEDSIHTKLVQKLHDADVIHITCNHGAVLEKKQSESEIKYNYPKKYLCGACKNEVHLYYGYYLTVEEQQLVYSRYQLNQKIENIDSAKSDNHEKWLDLKADIRRLVIENLRTNKLIETCKHDNDGQKFGPCKKCGIHVSDYLEIGELISNKAVDLAEKSLGALPVDTHKGQYGSIDKCFKNMESLTN